MRARTVGVKAAGPLAACSSPAFMLIGVLPTIAGGFDGCWADNPQSAERLSLSTDPHHLLWQGIAGSVGSVGHPVHHHRRGSSRAPERTLP